MALTEKQKRFCNEYLIDLNATQAAIRAGYSKKTARQTATENLSKPYIQQYIKERMSEKETQLIADQDEVLEYLTSVLRGAEEITKDRLKAAELLGKRYSLFSERMEVSGLEEEKSKLDDLINQMRGG